MRQVTVGMPVSGLLSQSSSNGPALRDAAGISDSVLSKQSRVLEDAGYVEVRKGAVGRRPRTWFRLTAEGRQALQGHLAWLAQLEEAVSASAPDAPRAETRPADRAQPRPVLPHLLGNS
jgi:DNA-binding MarR family transcriptional regulator